MTAGAGGTAGEGGAGGGVGGTGGTSGAGGAGGSGGASCLSDWRSTTPGAECVGQTQENLQRCAEFLDCYFVHGCGPTTCGSPEAVCGVNTLRADAAPKDIADPIYEELCEV